MTSFSGSILHIDSKTIARVTITHHRLQKSPITVNNSNNNDDDDIDNDINNDRDYDLTRSQSISYSSPLSNSCRAMEKNFSMIRSLYITATESSQLYSFSLSIFVSLQELYIDSCPPSTIDGLYDFRNQLKILKIVNSGIPELIKALAPGLTEELLRHYKPIILDSCSNDIANNFKWSQVSDLRLSNCGITRLDQSMHLFPSIQTLDLSRNDISHIIHLQDCYSLSDLNLSYNRISVLSNVGRVLGNVTTLNISHNLIASLDGIATMYSLHKIDLSYNSIDDFCEIRHLINLPCLEHIVLEGNDICENPMYRLMVFTQLLNGSLLTSDRSLPTLDRKALTKNESKQLGLMFRPPENHQKSISISRDYGADKNCRNGLEDSIAEVRTKKVEQEIFRSPLKISNFSNQGIIPSVKEAKRKTKNNDLRRKVEISASEKIPEYFNLDVLRSALYEVRCMTAADVEAMFLYAEERRLKELTLFLEEERLQEKIRHHELALKLIEYDKLMERGKLENKNSTGSRAESVDSASLPIDQRMARVSVVSSDSSINMIEVDLVNEDAIANKQQITDQKVETPKRKSSLSFLWKNKFLSTPTSSGKESIKFNETGDSIQSSDALDTSDIIDDMIPDDEEELKFIDEFEKDYNNEDEFDSRKDSNIYEFSDIVDGASNSYSHQYIGNPEYLDYIVLDNIELYLIEQVFNTLEESPYLLTKGLNDYEKIRTNGVLKQEKVLAHYCEQVVDMKSSKNNDADSESKLSSPKRLQKNPSIVVEDTEISIIIVLTETNIYMILKDSIKTTATFKDAPIPVLLRYHPLYWLESCSIFFSLQRCIFSFCSECLDVNAQDDSIQERYSYCILPRDKSRTSKIITKIPQSANIERNSKLAEGKRSNVKIINRDSQLLENISKYTHNIGMYPDIIHYQMLFLMKKNKSGTTNKACTIILTPDLVLLFKENFSIDDVDTSLIDSASYKDILKIEIAKGNPLILTMVWKPKKVFYSKRQWLLTADHSLTITKLHDELKKQVD